MFTWIPIQEEAAKRLLDFKDRSGDLVQLIADMHSAKLTALPIMDTDANGHRSQLSEIDPFTFMACFNRGIRKDNQQALWRFLKDAWNLKSPIPADFDGLPTMDKRNSWFMPYASKREAEHVPLLWQFFEHAIFHADLRSLDLALMQRCLDLPNVGLSSLTMGMFWAAPRKWIATDGKNLDFAEAKGVVDKPKTAGDYRVWLPKIRAITGEDAVEFSRAAHEEAVSSRSAAQVGKTLIVEPYSRFFKDVETANGVLDQFKRVVGILENNPLHQHDLRLVSRFRTSPARISVIFGNWPVFSFLKDGRCELLLPSENLLFEDGTKHFTFEESIEGVFYSLGWFDRQILEDQEVWDCIRFALDAVLIRFKGWRRSNYASNHSADLYRLIVKPEDREPILTGGGEVSPPETVGGANAWLIAAGEGGELWEEFQKHSEISIGWSETGDLSGVLSEEDFRVIVAGSHPEAGSAKVGKMLRDFALVMLPGDLVFAKSGRKSVLGHGLVESGYRYDSEAKRHSHVRKVKWLNTKAFNMPDGVVLPVQTLTRADKRPEVMEALTEQYDLATLVTPLPPDGYAKQDALADLFMPEQQLDDIIELLKRKKNIILQGAPGTGKTFVARRLAFLLMGVADDSRAPMVQFHQSTCYEDFIQGYRPDGNGGFALKDGSFYSFCQEAHAEPDKSFVFIIDEINRGNLSKIFGELMMLIEPDKRDPSFAVPLAYAQGLEETFHVPENVFLIGTMNTADRSLSMVDYALRRRFAFIEAEPGFSSPGFAAYLQKQKSPSRLIDAIRYRMETLNGMIAADTANLGRGYRIGHSFFVPAKDTVPDAAWYRDIVRYEVLPLIEEYWIDDPKQLGAAKDLLLQPIDA